MSITIHIKGAPYRDWQPESMFLGYQRDWIRDESPIKAMEKSRQIGISWSTAYALTRRQARAGTRYDAWVSSRDDIQAQLFCNDCKAFAGILDIAAEDLGLQVIDSEKAITAYVLRMATGTAINSMSSNPDAQAGKRGSRVLDEFALHKDPRKLYTIAEPGTTWGGIMEIISTHRGSGNFFNELIVEAREKGNPKKISLHRVTLVDALEFGFLAKLKQKLPADDHRQDMDEQAYFDWVKSRAADEESFLQEYMCVPADDASAFLEYDLIASCEYQSGDDWEKPLSECGDLYLGMDVGRKKDLSVIWLLESGSSESRKLTRRVIEMKNRPFSYQEQILWEILALPNLRRACIDATGLGMQLAERAQEQFGKYRVEAVTFTGPVKEKLAYPVRAGFEDKAFRIPFDPHIRADLRAIRKEVTAAGNIRFSADRSENGHADRFWALALANEAAKSIAAPTIWVKSGNIAKHVSETNAMTAYNRRHGRPLI